MNSLTQEGLVHQDGGRGTSPTGHWSGFSPPPSEARQSRRGVVGASTDAGIAVLVRTIEHEIIPRLVRAHCFSSEPVGPHVPISGGVSDADVQSFAMQALSSDENLAESCLAVMRARQISIETVYLDLLAPAARYLGRQWDEDLCDFSEVTMGLGRLQRVLRDLSPAFRRSIHQAGNGLRILLLPSPGEQHTFGLSMATEFFSRAGWDVAGGPWEAGVDPVVMVRQEWFDVVGFSLCTEINLPDLAECIRSVRSSAMNRQVGIIVGGPVFVQNPEFVAKVEADAVAADGRQAPELAEKLVAAQPRRTEPRRTEQRARACQCHP